MCDSCCPANFARTDVPLEPKEVELQEVQDAQEQDREEGQVRQGPEPQVVDRAGGATSSARTRCRRRRTKRVRTRKRLGQTTCAAFHRKTNKRMFGRRHAICNMNQPPGPGKKLTWKRQSGFGVVQPTSLPRGGVSGGLAFFTSKVIWHKQKCRARRRTSGEGAQAKSSPSVGDILLAWIHPKRMRANWDI